MMDQSSMLSQQDVARGERSFGNITLVSAADDDADDAASSRAARDRAAVLAIVREDRRRAVPLLDSLPFAVALPLRDALHRCRPAPPAAWPRAAYDLIGRADLGTVRFGVTRDTAPWRRIATDVGSGAGGGDASAPAQPKMGDSHDGLDLVLVRGDWRVEGGAGACVAGITPAVAWLAVIVR